MVKINGNFVKASGKTIMQYVLTTDYDLKRIAVEKNGEIVPKSCYDATVLEPGDVVEIVNFVGGG